MEKLLDNESLNGILRKILIATLAFLLGLRKKETRSMITKPPKGRELACNATNIFKSEGTKRNNT
jgi:hypothetical protein